MKKEDKEEMIKNYFNYKYILMLKNKYN